jgi:dihydroflavonol-4-reductase
MARIFVTGASGQVGSALVNTLCKQGHQVQVLLRPGAWHPALDGLDIRVCRGELLRAGDIARAMAGAEQVFHVAGMISYHPRDAWQMQQVNVNATALMVACALHNRVQRFVHTSSTAALGYCFSPQQQLNEDQTLDPRFWGMPYLKTKADAEAEVLRGVTQGLDAVIVNPSTIFGPGDTKMNTGKLLAQLQQGGRFAPPGGTAVVSLPKVIEGHLLAHNTGRTGQRYILSSLNLSYQELFSWIAACYQQPGPRYQMPRSLRQPLIAAMRLLQQLPPLADRGLSADLLRFSFNYRYYDARRAVQELGWQPDSPTEFQGILQAASADYVRRSHA